MSEISLGQIKQSVRNAIRDFGATLPEDRVVLTGGRVGTTTPSGLIVNMQDTQVERDFETRMTRKANVVLHMVLQGQVSAWLANDPLPLWRPDDSPVRIVLSALGQPAEFRRQVRRGQSLRKLTIVLPWDWLEARGIARDTILQGALHRCESWVAAASDVARAEALLLGLSGAPATHRAADDLLATLDAEALAIALVRQAVENLLTDTDRLRPQEREKLLRMEAHACRPGPLPPVSEIAEIGGMSVSTMRRLFHRAYDQPVQTRLRTLRMDNAARALRNGAPVTEAARLAGYETPTAFATAFRQATGQTPSRFARKTD